MILLAAGAAGGLAYGAQVHDIGGQIVRLLGAPRSGCRRPGSSPGSALFGVSPRLTALTWAGLIACVVLLELGALLGLRQWIVDASPFAHVPKSPGTAFSGVPLVWLTATAALLGCVGLVGFRRRDIG